MKIRAHHLLCMQGFQGYGYTRDFIDNMAGTIKNINSNPDLKIELTDECDAICSGCPHNVNGVCQKEPDSAQKIRALDWRVLRKLDLKKGTQITADIIFSLVNTKLKNIPDLQDICGRCEWKEKCLWFISRN